MLLPNDELHLTRILREIPIQHVALQAWIDRILADPAFALSLDDFLPIFHQTADPEDVEISMDAGAYLGPNLLSRLYAGQAHASHEHPLTIASDHAAAVLATAIVSHRRALPPPPTLGPNLP